MSAKQPRLVYFANNRLPTEKAHGLQIVQMCEALADAGYEVTLIAPKRFNTPEMRAAADLWTHYGVARNFAFRRLACVDLFPIFPRHHVALLTQTFTYLVVLLAWLAVRRADVVYTRDLFIGATLAALHPRVVYEAHTTHHSRIGRRLQAFIAQRARVVTMTAHLAEQMRALGADRVVTEHDGFRLARFEDMPASAEARAALDLPLDAFVVGYIGRLHTMGMSKGLDTLVDALAACADIPAYLLVVGGPDEGIAAVRSDWETRGLSADRLRAPGQVLPVTVPHYLAAMDVAVMPLPWTDHFARNASALKLFEYMAAGRAIIASDLPSTAEVARHNETALLVPPGDSAAWKDAIRQLYRDPALRARLGQRAQAAAQDYTWAARARRIRAFIES